jgi:hypothetical protein
MADPARRVGGSLLSLPGACGSLPGCGGVRVVPRPPPRRLLSPRPPPLHCRREDPRERKRWPAGDPARRPPISPASRNGGLAPPPSCVDAGSGAWRLGPARRSTATGTEASELLLSPTEDIHS